MEYGIQFAETGHLCLATLHANSANQALDRIINFFPEERRQQLLMDLSLNTKAFVSQRLIPREGGIGRIAAMEIMLGTPLIQDLIFKGEVGQIKEIMAKSTRLGMQTFDQALFDLYEGGTITYEEAMRNADSKNELRLRVKLESKRDSAIADQQSESLKIMEEDTGPDFLSRRVRKPLNDERKAAFQTDGGEKGLGPFLRAVRAGQDQDRRQDHAGQQARDDAEDGQAGGDRAHDGRAARDFTRNLEVDFAISEKGLGRFRVNVFHQRGNVGMVLRYITRIADARRARHAGAAQGTGHAASRPDPDGRRDGRR